ncbi:MAG: HEAT repeat domain-containing protein, partial [Saprospiraceae bacterium]|nr:HEAT repeat domain-containing protein [Saprospiraceae bacterium]
MISLSPFGLLAIKSVVIISLAWFAYLFTKRQTPKIRYFTLQLFFFMLVFLPLSMHVLPEWHWQYTNAFMQQESKTVHETFTPVSAISPDQAVVKAKTCINTGQKSIIEDLYTVEVEPEATSTTGVPWDTLLYWIWILGSTSLLLHLVRELLLLRRLRQSHESDENHPVIVQLWTSLKTVEQLPSPKFILDPSTQIPFTFGYQQPVIVLPKGAVTWPTERLKAVLLHEAAHIKHQDYLPNIIRRLACCLFWWNYPIWGLAKKVQLESEKRADQWVIKHEISPYDYAAQLVQITRLLQRPKYALVSSIGHANQLRNRVEHVIKENSNMPVQFGLLVKLTLLVLGCLTILSACFQTEVHSGYSSHAALQQKIHAPVDQLTPLIWQVGEEENLKAVSALETLLTHDSAQVRSLAAWALGEIKDQNSFASLKQLLQDEDSWVQEMAIRSIGELEVSASLDLIAPVLEAPHLHLRLAAVQA